MLPPEMSSQDLISIALSTRHQRKLLDSTLGVMNKSLLAFTPLPTRRPE